MPKRGRPDIGRRSQSNMRQRAYSRAKRTNDREKSQSGEPSDNIIALNEESHNDGAFTQEKTQIEKSSSKLQEEHLQLIRAQRTFYEEKNLRAKEKHEKQMETLSAKRERLYSEIANKKTKLNNSANE